MINEEMEVIQCSEEDETFEPNRLLKRNIGELAVDGKLNEDLKSPARKEVKISHETFLRRELDQWKELMKERGIRKSVAFSDSLETDANDFDAILKPDQKNFIAERIDVTKMMNESHEFRRKFDFFLRVNKLVINMQTERSNKALDKGRQQTIQFCTDFMHCEQFNSIEK